jgi:hypothetical protein
VIQFELTPKALANFSPGLERSDNPGFTVISDQTLKGFGGEFLSKVVYAKHQAATL